MLPRRILTLSLEHNPFFSKTIATPWWLLWDEVSLTPRARTEKWKWLLAPHCSNPCRSACQLCISRAPGLGVFLWENQKAVTLLGRCEFMLRLYSCLALLAYHEQVSGTFRRAQLRLRCLNHGNRHSLEQKQERERCPAWMHLICVTFQTGRPRHCGSHCPYQYMF